MKKLMIGLLVAAAGTGIYFFVIKKNKEKPIDTGFNKELIIGKWAGETKAVPYSTTISLSWEFRKDGTALFAASDTAKTDTLYYSWKDSIGLKVQKSPADSLEMVYEVSKLTADSLELKQTGSDPILLLKSK